MRNAFSAPCARSSAVCFNFVKSEFSVARTACFATRYAKPAYTSARAAIISDAVSKKCFARKSRPISINITTALSTESGYDLATAPLERKWSAGVRYLTFEYLHFEKRKCLEDHSDNSDMAAVVSELSDPNCKLSVRARSGRATRFIHRRNESRTQSMGTASFEEKSGCNAIIL